MIDRSRQRRWCPRCSGRMFLEWDSILGNEWACIVCGHRVATIETPVLPFVTRLTAGRIVEVRDGTRG